MAVNSAAHRQILVRLWRRRQEGSVAVATASLSFLGAAHSRVGCAQHIETRGWPCARPLNPFARGLSGCGYARGIEPGHCHSTLRDFSRALELRDEHRVLVVRAVGAERVAARLASSSSSSSSDRKPKPRSPSAGACAAASTSSRFAFSSSSSRRRAAHARHACRPQVLASCGPLPRRVACSTTALRLLLSLEHCERLRVRVALLTFSTARAMHNPV